VESGLGEENEFFNTFENIGGVGLDDFFFLWEEFFEFDG